MSIVGTDTWKKLEQHHKAIAPVQMRDLFAKDPGRFATFSLRLGDLLLDYSKNRITARPWICCAVSRARPASRPCATRCSRASPST
jgi:hypothetical protein